MNASSLLLGGEHDFADDVDDSIARLDINTDDFGHFVTRISGAFLIDLSGNPLADGATVLSIGHLRKGGALKIPAVHSLPGNDVEQEDIAQRGDVVQQRLDSTCRKVTEGFIGRGEDGEWTVSAKGSSQVCGLDSGTESPETLRAASNIGNRRAAFFSGERNLRRR